MMKYICLRFRVYVCIHGQYMFPQYRYCKWNVIVICTELDTQKFMIVQVHRCIICILPLQHGILTYTDLQEWPTTYWWRMRRTWCHHGRSFTMSCFRSSSLGLTWSFSWCSSCFQINGWWWLEHEFHVPIFWKESSHLTNIFQRVWNHQPERLTLSWQKASKKFTTWLNRPSTFCWTALPVVGVEPRGH